MLKTRSISSNIDTLPSIPLRPASEVVCLERMGCFHQTRLSFMRALLRNLKADQWQFSRTRWDVNSDGVGVAIYQAAGPERTYSLVCFAHDLPPEKRSDRVIADQWDATFALFDGVPTEEDIERLAANVPYQEAGQLDQSELTLSRANRSVRLFNHVIDRLSRGKQPDIEMIDQVGYLMRTTAVYGNGKFGLSDRERIADRKEFLGAFRSELLAVWLIRWFSVDIAEHLAAVRGPKSVTRLDPGIRRRLGVGNSTGLGMAPFLVTHPALLHTWISAREEALARVRNIEFTIPEKQSAFLQVAGNMQQIASTWYTDNARQAERIEKLREELVALSETLESFDWDSAHPWDRLYRIVAGEYSMETQELLVSMMIEPHGELVDELADTMAIDEVPLNGIDGSKTIGSIKTILKNRYDWALDTNFENPGEIARFWYVSEEKLEPRLGERFEEPGAEKEQPLAFARDLAALKTALDSEDDQGTIASFLMASPEYRSAVKRLQLADQFAYSEIHSNLIASDMVPVDLLRCKLSFFGANKFDPRSDRWVRITMYQGAPFPDEIDHREADDWAFGTMETNV